jgi:large subunit ribosomal protein L13
MDSGFSPRSTHLSFQQRRDFVFSDEKKGDSAMPMLAKTWMATKEQAPALRDWYVVDAEARIVGRLATAIATVLMGKHKATYTPHVDCGGNVIVINVEKVRFTGGEMQHPELPFYSTKMAAKTYQSYSGYPGGRRVRSAVNVWQTAPDRILREAVRRMLPKSKLGRHMLLKLKLFVGPEHPHQAQTAVDFPAHLLPAKKTKS